LKETEPEVVLLVGKSGPFIQKRGKGGGRRHVTYLYMMRKTITNSRKKKKTYPANKKKCTQKHFWMRGGWKEERGRKKGRATGLKGGGDTILANTEARQVQSRGEGRRVITPGESISEPG